MKRSRSVDSQHGIEERLLGDDVGSGGQHKAVVRLESLSATKLRVLFALAYVVLFAGVICFSLEREWRRHEYELRSKFISRSLDPPSVSSRVGFTVSTLQMYFSIDAKIEFPVPIGTDSRYQGFKGTLNLPLSFNLSAVGRNKSNLLVQQQGPIRFRYQATSVLTCTSDWVTLVLPQDYRFLYEDVTYQHDEFQLDAIITNASVVPGNKKIVLLPSPKSPFANMSTLISLDIRITHPSVSYKHVEVILHSVLSICTFSTLVYLGWKTWRESRNGVIIDEQRWLLLLLAILFVLQGPFFIPYIYSPRGSNRVLYESAVVCGVAAVPIFALLVACSISETAAILARRQALVGESGEHQLLFNASSTMVSSFGIWFYLPKLVLGALYMASILLLVNLASILRLHDQDPAFGSSVHMYRALMVASLVVFAVSCLVWAIWFFRSIIRSSRSLETLPYIPTRFRQLSFRFFVLITTVLLVFIVTTLLMQIVFTRPGERYSFSPFNTSITTTCIASFYTYILVYIYTPAPPREKIPVERQSRIRSLVRSVSFHQVSSVDEEMNSFSFSTALLLLDVSWQSYFDNPFDVSEEESVDISRYNLTFQTRIQDTTTDTTCFIFQKGDAGIISFRGTRSYENARTNVSLSRSTIAFGPEGDADVLDQLLGSLGTIHSGFQTAYLAIQPQILGSIHEIVEASRSSVQAWYICGHSLGGALACLCSYDLALRFPSMQIQTYTYGQPRVGDMSFANRYDMLVPNTYRIVCDQDIITSTPKFLYLYKHMGKEVLIDRLGNCILGPSFVEKLLKLPRRSIEDHSLVSYREGMLILHRAYPSSSKLWD